MKNVTPGKEVPRLIVDTVNGMMWNLRDQKPENLTLAVFYRGLHSPDCKLYLEELNSKYDEFRERGINIVCLSADSESLSEKTAIEWEVEKLTIGYNFSIEDARLWDLYVSKGMNEDEPDTFFEPGLFLIRPDNTLYAALIQSMPFVRPNLDELLKTIDYILNNDYPARGEA
jgi:peroxiredoxin